MCAQTADNPAKYRTLILYLTAIILACLVGASNIASLQHVGIVIADLFVKIFKFISLPIITLSIIVTLTQYNADAKMTRIWQRTLIYTFGTTLIAASISCVLYLLIAPHNIAGHLQAVEAPHGIETMHYIDYLLNLIPSNIFAPFIEQQVMSALLISLVVGIAIRQIPDDTARTTLSQFFQGAHSVFMLLATAIIKIIPLALFGFITSAIVQLRTGVDLSGLGLYLMVIVLANLIQGFVILPTLLYVNRLDPWHTMRGMLPALSVAFFSKSSAGTLPVTMATAETNLKLKPEVSRFVLPLCTSINMNGCAAFIFTTVVFLMQNHGLTISPMTMLLWIVVSTIAAIGNAGVPMGCFFLSLSLLTSMNIPITLLWLILPFYSIIDMIETALNVWSDSCVAAVIDKQVVKE